MQLAGRSPLECEHVVDNQRLQVTGARVTALARQPEQASGQNHKSSTKALREKNPDVDGAPGPNISLSFQRTYRQER